MNSHEKNPPEIAKKLLNVILPPSLKDDISGDLEEEYHHHLKMGNTMKEANHWYWSQTMTTCSRYLFTQERLITYLIITLALFILAIFSVGITVLSNGSFEYFQDEFWTNGNVHLLFFEAKFWEYSSTAFLSDFTFNIFTFNTFVDLNSFLWSVVVLLALFKLNKKYKLNTTAFIAVALIAMFSGQIYGMAYFKMTQVENIEAGPLIAMMWLTVMYMILPISYAIIRKVSLKRNVNLY